MKQYINKDAVVAEIENCYNECIKRAEIVNADYWNGQADAYRNVLITLDDALEVKEVQEEPVSNDLEAEFVLYLKHKFNIPQEGHKLKTNGWRPSPYDILDIAKHFAQWQKEQMEKNRIAHCDNITEEQYNLESGFLDSFLDKNKECLHS